MNDLMTRGKNHKKTKPACLYSFTVQPKSNSFIHIRSVAQSPALSAALRTTMAAQEVEHFFDSVSEASSANATLEEATLQATQINAPWLAPELPDNQPPEGIREAEEIRLATNASLALAREEEEIRLATNASLAESTSASSRPAKAPPSPAKVKAPPPDLYHFRCLADDDVPSLPPWPRNSPPPTGTRNGEPAPPALRPGKSPPPAVPRNAEPEAESTLPLETISPAQSEQRATASQGTASTEQEARRSAITGQPAQDLWVNYTEVGDAYYQDPRNQQRTRDVRLTREVWYPWLDAPLPRVHLWASTLFEDPSITTELEFLKAWHTAAHNHDHGIRRIWKQYCVARGDGTQDPRRLLPVFSRIFLFLYCGQKPDFFTQHPNAKLLPLSQEEQLVREGAAEYEATHVRYQPPRMNWPPPEVFLAEAEVPQPQSHAQGPYWNGPAQHFAALGQLASAAEEASWRYDAPASSWQGAQQWGGTQPGNWDWTAHQGGWWHGWQW